MSHKEIIEGMDLVGHDEIFIYYQPKRDLLIAKYGLVNTRPYSRYRNWKWTDQPEFNFCIHKIAEKIHISFPNKDKALEAAFKMAEERYGITQWKRVRSDGIVFYIREELHRMRKII